MSQSPAERQRAYRARKKVTRSITISLTKQEAEIVDACFSQADSPNLQNFYKEAFITGAKFRANSGVPKGKKVK